MVRPLKMSIAYFTLALLFALTAFLNEFYRPFFFPGLPKEWVWCLCFLGTVVFAIFGWNGWNRFRGRRQKAVGLILEAVQARNASAKTVDNDLANAERTISRLIANREEDLTEIGPDLTLESLGRLAAYLPTLLAEVENELDARIRLGIVGVYLGETLCRNKNWRWLFKADPNLRQFNYLVSSLEREGRKMDPFMWAGDLFAGRKDIRSLKEIM